MLSKICIKYFSKQHTKRLGSIQLLYVLLIGFSSSRLHAVKCLFQLINFCIERKRRGFLFRVFFFRLRLSFSFVLRAGNILIVTK